MMSRPNPRLPTVSLVSCILLRLCTDGWSLRLMGLSEKKREICFSPSPGQQHNSTHGVLKPDPEGR